MISAKETRSGGFTIVELLIVIVVIAILAAISIVAYNGVQQRARDSQRKADISALEKAMELYYIDKGMYPPTGVSCGDAGLNGWATTADKDGCWAAFMDHLKPYTSNKMILDPSARAVVGGTAVLESTNYTITTYYCSRQTYVIQYNDELSRSGPVVEGGWGGCSTGGNYLPNATRHAVIRSKI